MGGGPALEDAYGPCQWPYDRCHDGPFYAPGSRPEYFGGVQAALTGLIAALQDSPFCAIDRNRYADGNEGNSDVAREGTAKPNGVTAQKTAFSDNSVELPKKESTGAQERRISSPVVDASLSPEVSTSPSVRSDVEGESVDSDVKNDDEVHESRPSSESAEVVKEGWSDEERRAATIVQTRFRGHVVRKSRPLVQLRSIAGIKAELERLKEKAGDATFLEELRKEKSKAKLGFEEGTLALLIQLDNVQGSHTLVRQIRKSVAREIVVLQESFDSLLAQRTSTSGR